MDIAIFAAIGFVAGALAMLLLAKWKPTWFVLAETDVANTLKITGSSNSTITVANTH